MIRLMLRVIRTSEAGPRPAIRRQVGNLPHLAAIFLSLMASGQGIPDRVFENVPFEQWLKGGDQTRFRWSVRTLQPVLSNHQRMVTRFLVEVDGTEFVKRPGKGRMVAFLEIRDRQQHVYQNHCQLDFSTPQKPSDLAAINVTISAFLNPGEYRVATAIYDIDTKEHSLKQSTLHVPEVVHDPLTGFWQGLPPVEFITSRERPDVWYMPEITSRAHLPVRTERPVRIEVLVNESPSEASGGRVGQATRRSMGTLIPALKLISQMEVSSGSLNVTMLDIERRKVSFAQEEVRTLDWTSLLTALGETNPNLIDVHALENHEQNAQFFVSEVRKRLEGTETNGDVPLGLSADPARVLIVLSGPMAFPKGQDLHPIEAKPEPGSHVFYIRFYPAVPAGRRAAPVSGIPVGRLPSTIPSDARRYPVLEDSLEGTLKPLAPKVFNVSSPIEFRRALGSIMTEISQLK